MLMQPAGKEFRGPRWWRGKEFRASVTGHRDLVVEDLGRIESAVREKLGTIRAHAGKAGFRTCALQSALAPGADQLVARVALESGWNLIAVLPSDEARYRDGFDGPGAREEFQRLRGEARIVLKVAADDGEGYSAVGRKLVESAHLVIGLWDGIDTGKDGGTGWVMREAQKPQRSKVKGPVATWHLGVRRRSNPHPVGEVLAWQRVECGEDRVATERKKVWWHGFWTGLRRTLPVAVALASVVFGTFGFMEYKGRGGVPFGWPDALFHAIGLPILQTVAVERDVSLGILPWALEVGRGLGVLAFVAAFVLAGYEFLATGIFLRFVRGHAVLAGLGTIGRRLALDLRRNGFMVVGVDRSLSTGVGAWCRAHGIGVVEGDMRDEAVLSRAACGRANRVFLMSRDERANIRAAGALSRLFAVGDGGGSSPAECFVRLESPAGVRALSGVALGSQRIKIEGINRFAATARVLMSERWFDRFSEPGQRSAEVAVIGDGQMSEALVMQALRVGHFEPERSLAVTVLSREPEVAANRFLEMNPVYRRREGGVLQAGEPWQGVLAKVSFLSMPPNDRVWLEDGFPLWDLVGSDRVTSVYVADAEGAACVALARVLLPKLARLRERLRCDAQSFVYFDHAADRQRVMIEENLNRLVPALPVCVFTEALCTASLDAFQGIRRDRLARRIALFYECLHCDTERRACASARVGRRAGGEVEAFLVELGRIRATAGRDMRGLSSGVLELCQRRPAAVDCLADDVWAELSEENRDSNRQAADHVAVKRRIAGRLEHLGEERLMEILSRVEHDRWCSEKLLKGFAPVDRDARDLDDVPKGALAAELLHRDLIPFDDLSAEERCKDWNQVKLVGLARLTEVHPG